MSKIAKKDETYIKNWSTRMNFQSNWTRTLNWYFYKINKQTKTVKTWYDPKKSLNLSADKRDVQILLHMLNVKTWPQKSILYQHFNYSTKRKLEHKKKLCIKVNYIVIMFELLIREFGENFNIKIMCPLYRTGDTGWWMA